MQIIILINYTKFIKTKNIYSILICDNERLVYARNIYIF